MNPIIILIFENRETSFLASKLELHQIHRDYDWDLRKFSNKRTKAFS